MTRSAFQGVVELRSEVRIREIPVFERAVLDWLEQDATGVGDPSFFAWLIGPRSLKFQSFGRRLSQEDVVAACREALDLVGEHDSEVRVDPFDPIGWAEEQAVAAIASMREQVRYGVTSQSVLRVFNDGSLVDPALLQLVVDIADAGDGRVLLSTQRSDGAILSVQHHREFIESVVDAVPLVKMEPAVTSLWIRIAVPESGCVASVSQSKGSRLGGPANMVEECLRTLLVDSALPSEAYLVVDSVDDMLAPAGSARSMFELLSDPSSSTREEDRAAVLRMIRSGEAERVTGYLHGVSERHHSLFSRRDWKQREDVGRGRFIVRT